MRRIVVAALFVLMSPQADAAEPEEGLTTLHLSQTAERAIRRDRVRAVLRAEAVGSDAKRVQADINRLMSAAVERAKSVAGVKVETLSYAVFEERQSSAPSRWRGSQGLSLFGADFPAVLGLVGDLQGQGLAISGLGFELAPDTARAAEDELTTEALARLRQRADRIASDLQLTLVRLHDVRVHNAEGGPPVLIRDGIPKLASAPPPAAEAGDDTVRVSIDADIILGLDDRHSP